MMIKARWPKQAGVLLPGILCAILIWYAGVGEVRAACNAPDATPYSMDMEVTHQEFYPAGVETQVIVTVSGYEGGTQPVELSWEGIVNGSTTVIFDDEDYTITLPVSVMTPGDKQLKIKARNAWDDYPEENNCWVEKTIQFTVLKVDLDLKTTGPLSAGNNLASDPDIVARFGTSCSLGGPVIVNNAAVDPTAANTIGHLVEIKGTPTPAPSAGGPTISRYNLTQKRTKYTTTVRFSDGSQLGPSSSLVNVPDDPEIVQNNSGDHFFTLDAPGPGSDAMFSYFGPTPPPISGQPPGTTVTAIVFRMDLSTQGTFDGSPCGEVLWWFVEYNIHGPTISDVNSTGGEVVP